MDARATDAFKLDEATRVLGGTPGVLRGMLEGLGDTWTATRPAQGAWSVRDVLGHLIQGEREDWAPRLQRILEHGVRVPFEPFDRSGHAAAVGDASTAELLGTFKRERAASLERVGLLALDPAQLDLVGVHPALGRVTARQLLATWVAHDLAHVGQIARTVAWHYRDAVGPWNHPDYLGGLHRSGAG